MFLKVLMSGYELYIFFLCMVVFVLLTVLATVLLGIILKLTIRVIRGGLEDESIKREPHKSATATEREDNVCFTSSGREEKSFFIFGPVLFDL